MRFAIAAIVTALLSSSASAVYTLQPNTPDRGSAAANGHAYYRFGFDKASNYNVIISVTAGEGDPDLFVDCTPYPTSAAPFRRTEYGNDTISLTPAQLVGAGCTLYVYIMVQGAGDVPGQSAPVNFIIVAGYATSQFAVTIRPGTPGTVVAAQNSIGYAMFVSTGTPVAPLIFALSVQTGGGAEMYVSQNPSPPSVTWPVERCLNYSGSTGLCKHSEVLPSTYTLATTSAGQSATEVRFNSYAAGQVYIVAVVSSAGDALTAAVSVSMGISETQLQLGQEERPFLGQYEYARYYAIIMSPTDGSQPSIVINSYPIAGGAATYASDKALPTNTTARWLPTPGAADSQVNIPYADLVSSCPGFASGSNCTIHVAVQGLGVFINYIQVYASYSNSPSFPEDLVMGGTVNLDLAPRTYGYTYTLLNIPKGQPAWTIAAEILSGSAEVYIVLGTGRRFYPSTTADAHPSSSSGVALARFEPPASLGAGAEQAVLANHRCLGRATPAPRSPPSFRGTAEQLARAKQYAAALLALPTDSPGPCPDPSSVGDMPSAVIPGVYCSNCEVRVSVFSGSYGAQVTVTLTVDDVVELTPLVEGIPSAGVVGYGSYDFYSFQVAMQTPSPIQLQLDSLSGGDADMYITVQNPADPNAMPSTSSYSWRSIASGSDLLEIAVTDHAYVSTGTYLVAVYGAKFLSDSEYSITARVESAAIIDPLPVNHASTVTISTGAYHFFTFTPCAGSQGSSGCGANAVPVVKFQWTLGMGSCSVFITDQYHPGSSSSAYLPTSGNKVLTTLWSITNLTQQAFIGPGVPKYNQASKVYTLGILGTSPFAVQVSMLGLFDDSGSINIVQLTPGVAVGPFVVSETSNQYFAVDYADGTLNTDLFLSADTEYGSADIVVAPPQARTGEAQTWAPRCRKGVGLGAPPVCLGYVFQSTTSPPEVGLDHVAPCFPYSGKTNNNCTLSMFREGRWLFTVYARTAAKYSVMAQFGDSHITLEEGVTASASTQITTVCSNRDPTTGQCPQGSGSVAFGAWLTVEVPIPNPNSGTLEDAQVVINRQCNFGGCRAPLEVFVISCYPPGMAPAGYRNCDDKLAFPSAEYAQESHHISKQSGGIPIPAQFTCGGPVNWNDDALPASNDDNQALDSAEDVTTGKCVFYFGVFSGRTKTSPGFFEVFDATFSASNDNSITIISQDETRPGTTFDGGVERLATDTLTKYYDAYFNTTAQPSVRVSAYACAGMPTLYACWPGSSGCSNPLNPSSGNSAQSATFSLEYSAAVMTFTSLPAAELNLGVAVSAQGSTFPGFRLTITSGSGPILYGPNDLAAAFNPSGGLEVAWGRASIYRQGQMMERQLTQPTVYVFKTASLPAGAILGTDCGIHNAYDQLSPSPAPSASPAPNSPALRFELPFGQTQYTVMGLDPTQFYSVALRVECSGPCAPTGHPNMFAGSKPVQVVPAGASASPSPVVPGEPSGSAQPTSQPTSVPVPSAGVSPSPGPSDAGLGGGAIAGIAIGSIAALGAAGGLFWWCRGTGGMPGDEMGYYTSAD